MNSIPPFLQNRGDIKYIEFEILQIVSSSEDVKFSNIRGLYLRKYGICFKNKIFNNLLEVSNESMASVSTMDNMPIAMAQKEI